MGFNTPDEVDAWLFQNPMRCPGALHFQVINDTQIKYGIQTNSTPVARRGTYEDPTFKFQIPLQIAAEREMARLLIGGIATSMPFLLLLCFVLGTTYVIPFDINSGCSVIHEAF